MEQFYRAIGIIDLGFSLKMCIFAQNEDIYKQKRRKEMKNKVIVEGKTPKIMLNEQSQAQGGVSIQEGILLAKQLARKIIETKKQNKW